MRVSRPVFWLLYAALLAVGISVDLAVDTMGLDVFVRALIKTVWLIGLVLIVALLHTKAKEESK